MKKMIIIQIIMTLKKKIIQLKMKKLKMKTI